MIDWYTGLVGYDASGKDTGYVQLLLPGGVIQSTFNRWVTATSSSDEGCQIKPDECTLEMVKDAEKYKLLCAHTVYKISLCPAKFLQGHNVFGPSVVSLGPVVQAVIRALPDNLRPPDADSSLLPAVRRDRVDVTTSIRMDSHAMVHEWIEHAKTETRSRHTGKRAIEKGLTGGTSVYWGKGSKRWMMKAYCKLCELKANPPNNQMMFEDLREYAEGLLRIELELHRKELKDRGTLDESIIWEFFDRIEVGVMKDDIIKAVLSLRPPVRLIYQAWLDGHDVSPEAGYLKRAAFYKYRKLILLATGQDISLEPPKKKAPVGTREHFGKEYLKEHEVKQVPEQLQKYLFKPKESPRYRKH